MRYLILPFCLVALLAPAPGADAHAFLVKAEPGVGAVVASAPRTVKIQFTEPLLLPRSDIKVMDRAGATFSTNPHFEGANRRVLVVDLSPLSPGAYNVEWRVVSVDVHQTEGKFTFTVK